MKTKLNLKKEVVISLSALNQTRAGQIGTSILDKNETFLSDCRPTANSFYSDCACDSLYNCDPFSMECPVKPMSEECGGVTHDCSYACTTVLYSNCNNC